jgi:hypothetical protein
MGMVDLITKTTNNPRREEGNEYRSTCLWPLVVMNAAVFVIFAFSFTQPRTGRD